MKTLITNYTFTAASKQVSLTDFVTIESERLLLITNVTDNIIIYNFADPSSGGTVSGNTITLSYNTTTMSNSDKLQIYYDTTGSVATDETLVLMNAQLTAMQEQNVLMRRLLKVTDSMATVDVNQRQRVVVENTLTMPSLTVGTFSPTNTTVKPVENGNAVVYAINGNSFTTIVAIPDVWRTIDTARNAYQNGIRSNLIF